MISRMRLQFEIDDGISVGEFRPQLICFEGGPQMRARFLECDHSQFTDEDGKNCIEVSLDILDTATYPESAGINPWFLQSFDRFAPIEIETDCDIDKISLKKAYCMFKSGEVWEVPSRTFEGSEINVCNLAPSL